MLAAKGRITMALSPSAWRRDLLGLGLVEIPVDGEMGVTAAQLDLHGDPADRIIAATVLLRGAVLITADSTLLEWKSPMECSTHACSDIEAAIKATYRLINRLARSSFGTHSQRIVTRAEIFKASVNCRREASHANLPPAASARNRERGSSGRHFLRYHLTVVCFSESV